MGYVGFLRMLEFLGAILNKPEYYGVFAHYGLFGYLGIATNKRKQT